MQSRHGAKAFASTEVVNMVRRRCRLLAEKLPIVQDFSRPVMSVSYVARNHGFALDQFVHMTGNARAKAA